MNEVALVWLRLSRTIAGPPTLLTADKVLVKARSTHMALFLKQERAAGMAAPGTDLAPITETGPTVPPVSTWGLAPSFWAHIPLLAADVAALQEVPGVPGSFALGGQPVRRVEVVGVAVEVECRDKYARVTVDDGSGLLPAVLWLQPNGSTSGAPEDSRHAVAAGVEKAFAVQAAHELQLGRLVRVQGRVTHFRDTRQVTVDTLQVEHNPNSEVLHWLDCMRMKKRLQEQQM